MAKKESKKGSTRLSLSKEALFGLPLAPPAAKPSNLSVEQQSFSKKLINSYFKQPIEKSELMLTTRSSDYWEKAGQKKALNLFHEVAARVPAYKDFLKKNRIKPDLVKKASDFAQVPLINKENYLKAYPLEDLSWDGLMPVNNMISVSSGSSGVPMYWPRGSLLEMESTWLHELMLHRFKADQKKTLVVDLFSMGMYIAGPITLNSVLRVAQKGYPITLITPGLDMNDAMSALTNVMDQFEQIVFAGYPPFIKDVIDEGKHRGLNWKRWQIRYILAGEGFTEGWRDYMGEVIGQKKSVLVDSVNLYGTADAAVVGHETPTSVAIRRRALADNSYYNNLFSSGDSGRLPSLVQYYPTLKYFESVNGELVFTATAGVPLIRYNINDLGGIVSFSGALTAIGSSEQEIAKELKETDRELNVTKLPFLYLYGKSDLTVTLYGLNIYPENIKLALEQRAVRKSVSGRFAMSTEYHAKTKNQYLQINVELARGIRSSRRLEKEIADEVIATLRSVNLEYGKLYSSVEKKKAMPVVKLFAHQESNYFNRAGKQHWKV